MIVQKQVFELPRITTENGAVLKQVRIGWESYGTLNAERSNAVLVTHYFSGTSHAAGRYDPRDELPGYWDAIIGPGKAIDTDRYFVLSSDTLVNINARDPNVVTTGPASIDPDTGKPYGMRFPVVSIGDFVNVQKALVESLGITRLKAIVGPSMGALQAYQWAVAWPHMVDRIIAVIGAAGGDPFLMAWLKLWAQPIRLDPKWNGGDYYDGEPPLDGLTAAFETVILHASQSQWAREVFGRAPADPDKDPAHALDNPFRIEAAVRLAAAARAALADANNFLYMVRANQLASADPAKITTPALIVSSPTDLVFPAEWVARTVAAIRGNGTRVETATIAGPLGHLNGLQSIGQAAAPIADFLGG
ncbi:MAG TPA: homoserine O-acetyltransferase [Beijerinckiaceae bacterium]|nr:homoserine O-acetyltransferase [Beijerinckiaceae bacterium]